MKWIKGENMGMDSLKFWKKDKKQRVMVSDALIATENKEQKWGEQIQEAGEKIVRLLLEKHYLEVKGNDIVIREFVIREKTKNEEWDGYILRFESYKDEDSDENKRRVKLIIKGHFVTRKGERIDTAGGSETTALIAEAIGDYIIVVPERPLHITYHGEKVPPGSCWPLSFFPQENSMMREGLRDSTHKIDFSKRSDEEDVFDLFISFLQKICEDIQNERILINEEENKWYKDRYRS